MRVSARLLWIVIGVVVGVGYVVTPTATDRDIKRAVFVRALLRRRR